MNIETLLGHLRAAIETLESGDLPTPESSDLYELTIGGFSRGGVPTLLVRGGYFRRAFAGRAVDVIQPRGSSGRVMVETTIGGLVVTTSIPLAEVAPQVEIPTMPTTYTVKAAGGAS